ncbi:hypothetical protein [Thermosediminibacter litoriperuensis]|uniref:Uncharacterized protein n=1 Tax=Thermosediminibacter litoriperuensis TaxID=291989 RepID=A0A5S5AF85_9FIRM|nr:hypothetical protein [Thermosediminibacter litoriperuensis]TYP48693.1 hypothetical protein LZ11_02298 [Thermosediminibacter litoriperuensis]
MSEVDKKIGLGTLSLILCIIGILFSFSFGDVGCYGDTILKSIGLETGLIIEKGSRVTFLHYTPFYSLLFFIPSVIIGYKYRKNHIGALLGAVISSIIVLLLIVATFITIVHLKQLYGAVGSLSYGKFSVQLTYDYNSESEFFWN